MGYQRSNYGPRGEERWRDRNFDRDNYGSRGFDRDRSFERGAYDEDRGFFERAGDEVRSWFGDDEAQRRRAMDERQFERERAARGDSGWSSGDYASDSWRADRPSGRSGYEERGFSFLSSHGHGAASGRPDFSYREPGSYRERRPYRESGVRGGDLHDPHYSEWRSRQIDALDRDYDEYRREHQSKFEQEFGNWRGRRQSQRESLRQVAQHMEVVGSDGEKIGIVDKVRGDRIILTRNDETAGGRHHSIPCGWIDRVEDKVFVDKSAAEARDEWRNEERSRALFEREDQGSDGPHALNRSFSGTY